MEKVFDHFNKTRLMLFECVGFQSVYEVMSDALPCWYEYCAAPLPPFVSRAVFCNLMSIVEDSYIGC